MDPKRLEYILIETKDGSHTVSNSQKGFNYHSQHGAIQESKHIFIKHGLTRYLELHPNKSTINILEIGFGTGLNALLSMLEAKDKEINILYTGIELHPLPLSFIKTINYPSILNLSKNEKEIYFQWFKDTDTGQIHQKSTNIQINILQKDFIEFHTSEKFDIIYYDAFGPSESPELWNKDILSKASILLKIKGILVSFCAKGQVKRDLKSNGLFVECPPGPPGKREITRAIKQ